MNRTQHSLLAAAYLEELCAQLDQGRKLKRRRRDWWNGPWTAQATALGFAASLAGCGGVVETASVQAEVCNDKVDNDGDGKTDCEDSKCGQECVAPVYSAPGPEAGKEAEAGLDGPSEVAEAEAAIELCNDGIDNDGDGRIDCLDVDCAGATNNCYMGAIEICNDGHDNDYDNKVDCQDEDCAGTTSCPAYVAPLEDCDNNKDDDWDDLVDCLDPDCASKCKDQ